jgi:hypothetical protein
MRANKSRDVVQYHHLVCVFEERDSGNNVASVEQRLRATPSDALASNRVERSPSSRSSSCQRDFATWYQIKSIT